MKAYGKTYQTSLVLALILECFCSYGFGQPALWLWGLIFCTTGIPSGISISSKRQHEGGTNAWYAPHNNHVYSEGSASSSLHN